MEETTNNSPGQSPQDKRIVSFNKDKMDFGSALKEAAEGKRVRRLEWEDEGIYLTFYKEQLMIFLTKDKTLHPLVVSFGDVAGEDWVIVK